ncbi:MAG: Crp/Fnr family transcriptional regulator [Candidatus Omnitrophica bacterium]|nr:Crp/Fnr family transcriptional regulator [Candidatus Omnitrophota bacterium]
MPLPVKNVPLFRDLPPEELNAIKSCLVEKDFKKGEILFHEGAVCERVFIVQEGRVKVYRTSSSGREQILEILGPGDTCACNPGALNWSCLSSATAVTACKVWFLSRNNYVRMVQTHAKVSQALNKLFADRLRCLSSLVEEVSLKDSKKRLVKFLLDMQAEKKSKGAGAETLFIPFTREEIAQRLGVARETIARRLYQLKRLKLIDVKAHEIIIRNQEGLEKLLF